MKLITGFEQVGQEMAGVTVAQNRERLLTRLGFCLEKGSTHTSRTIMLEDLAALFAYVEQADADKEKFRQAVETENCLGKRSVKTRQLTFRHLVALYALDPAILMFRALRFFWDRDPDGRPLQAMLCAYARDSLLRMSASFILKHSEGAAITREALEVYIEENAPDRFSPATLKSTAQNLNSSWTKSGHLNGRQRKIRSRAIATPGSVAYALLLGYLTGVRGESLFHTEYAALLDCPPNYAMELAEDASRRGWMVFKRIGNVMEALFPNLITNAEMEMMHE